MEEILMELHYKLDPADIYESLTCMAYRTEGSKKRNQIIVLSIIGVICLCLYCRDFSQIHYFLVTASCAVLSFLLIYFVPFRRRKKAKKLAAQAGSYYIRLDKNGVLSDKLGEKLDLSSKKVQIYESAQVITITQNRGITYCIPKRLLESVHLEQLYDLLGQINRTWINVYL